ncbi:MAG: ATP-binding cassette domain-containing protein [Paraclostridium sp.]
MELKLESISKSYKNTIAISDINITFTQGIWGILGANGAGKSTLIELIVGNLNPTSGSIKYNEKSITNLGDSYRELIGYLPQKFTCDNSFNLYDYLEYMCALKDIKDSKKRINELIDLLELQQYRDKLVTKLSGGTKQRVGIAQALLNNPKILILDEPTAGLDPKERIKFKGIISKISQDKIILFSTHIVSDIESISTNNVIIRNGKVIDIGHIDNLLENMDANVFEIDIDNKEIDIFEEEHVIVNIKTYDTKNSRIRFIAKENTHKNGTIQNPTLEDYYIWILKEKLAYRRKE